MEADNQAFLYENLPVFLSCSFLRKPNSSRKSRGGGGEKVRLRPQATERKRKLAKKSCMNVLLVVSWRME